MKIAAPLLLKASALLSPRTVKTAANAQVIVLFITAPC